MPKFEHEGKDGSTLPVFGNFSLESHDHLNKAPDSDVYALAPSERIESAVPGPSSSHEAVPPHPRHIADLGGVAVDVVVKPEEN